MLSPVTRPRVYLALGRTDMRKAINGLSLIVQERMGLDPFGESLFVFCNRSRKIMKILYWETNGFCLWQKRLERQCFRWPEANTECLSISQRELRWLMDGLELPQTKAHHGLSYSRAS
jgi:transposase